MTLDYGATLFGPVYAELGVPATMGGTHITVIDNTRRKPLPIVSATGPAEVRSVGPSAFARIYELAAKGITPDLWEDAALVFNGQTWTVRSWERQGSPAGENAGEVLFLLKQATTA
ncbi:MAG TPA: hypothetical protein VKG24_29200 [Pseudolabrys sp.]|nr:hypothetical protein [Pseudolabrys sp.]